MQSTVRIAFAILALTSVSLAGEGPVRLSAGFTENKSMDMPEQALAAAAFRVDLEGLAALRYGHPEEAVLPLVNVEMDFHRTYSKEREKTTTWRGVNKETGTSVVLTLSDGSFYATYRTGVAPVIIIPVAGQDQFAAYRLDQSRQAPLVGCGIEPDGAKLDQFVPKEEAAKYQKQLVGKACQTSAQIDVMILYTPGLATRLAGNLDARLQHLVDLSNEAYVNSQVDMELHLVHSQEVDYPDDTDIGDALEDITFLSGNSNPGVFDGVETLRDQYGVDQVTLLRDLKVSGGFITCGIAYLVSTNNVMRGARSAYAVVDDHSFRCFDLAYAHEVGHNLGLAHDRATVDENGGGGGKYSYSYGYQDPGAQFVTIMGYDFTGVCPCGYIPNFSNPRVSVDGLPTGVDEDQEDSADNAKTLEDTRFKMALYRNPVLGSSLEFKYYVPQVSVQGGDDTYVGIVNPNSSTATVEVHAFSTSGDLLGKFNQVGQVPARNRAWFSVKSAFPGTGPLIGWVQVGSSQPLDVFAELQNDDVRSAYWSSDALKPQLFVPHVAKNTAQFETVIATINGSGTGADADITPEPFGDTFELLDLECGYTQTSGNAVDYFGADLIEIVDWATLESSFGSVAAMEYFSYLPDRDRVASLGLSDQTGSQLRFLHVAADVGQFWTGLVYMNTSSSATDAVETYYDGSGSVLATEQVALIPGQKRTLLFDANNTEPSGTVWVDVQADAASLVGYELFGSANGTPNRFFAGLQGSYTSGSSLVYPLAQSTAGQRWTGIVALNVGGQNSDITFDAMNDSGAVIESSTLTAVAPNLKIVQTLSSMFSESTLGQATWVRATTTGSQWAGFELWGDLGDVRGHLSGIVASVSN